MKKYHFTDAQLDAARNLAYEMMSEIVPHLSVSQNMVQSLMMRTTDLNAESVVYRLRTGLDTFHTLYQQAETMPPGSVIRAGLDRGMKQMDAAQQRMLLTMILNGFSRITHGAVRVDPDADLESMTEAVAICFDEYGLAYLSSDIEASGSDDMDPTYNKLLDACQQQQNEAYTALAMYLLITDGTLDQIPCQLSPESIGAVTAASLQAQRSILERIMGKIDMDALLRTLKFIAGITLVILAMGAALELMGLSALMITDGLGLLLAFDSWLWCLVGACISFGGMLLLSGSAVLGAGALWLFAESDDVKETWETIRRKIREFLDNTLIPAARSFGRDLCGCAVAAAPCQTAAYMELEAPAAAYTDEDEYVQIPAN